jgi:hypothetical protein
MVFGLTGQAWASSLSITGSLTDSTNLAGATSISMAGHYAYVAAYGDGSGSGSASSRLTALDVADPAHPVFKGSTADARLAGADGVFSTGHYAYVAATNSNSLVIVDVSDPTAPMVVGAVHDDDLLNQAYSVFVSGQYAYVAAQGCVPKGCTASGGNALVVVDVADPSAPAIAGSYRDAIRTHHADSVQVVGNRAYLTAFYSDTVTVLDVSNPASPSLVGSVTDPTNLHFPNSISVDPAGRYAYVVDQTSTGRLTVLDLQTSANPTVVGSVASSTALSNAYWLTVAQNYAYVAAPGNDALTVVDISKPAAPTVVDSLSDSTALRTVDGVALQGSHAFVSAFGDNTFTAVDVAGYTSAPGSGTGGHLAFESGGSGGPASIANPRPDTVIRGGPSGRVRSRSAKFRFSSPVPGATFVCRLDKGRYRACRSPFTVHRLRAGLHVLAVRARTATGVSDLTPAFRVWQVGTRGIRLTASRTGRVTLRLVAFPSAMSAKVTLASKHGRLGRFSKTIPANLATKLHFRLRHSTLERLGDGLPARAQLVLRDADGRVSRFSLDLRITR